MRDRSKSRDNLRIDSPTSPLYNIPVQKKTSPFKAVDKFIFLDPKYRPQKEAVPSLGKQTILATIDNKTFTAISIPDMSSVAKVKSVVATELGLDVHNIVVHLTEFGCQKGQALEDSMLHDVLHTSYSHQMSDCIKLFVSSTSSSLSDPHKSSSSLSLSDLSPQNEPFQFLNTPSHMLHDGGNSANTDYFKINTQNQQEKVKSPVKIHVSSDSNAPTIRLVPHEGDSGGTNPGGVATGTATTTALNEQQTGVPKTQYRPSDDSFKVIRPARREINFDDRRPSPYERKASSNLVALRDPPPPPVSRSQSIKSLTRSQSIKSVTSLKRQGTVDKKNSSSLSKEAKTSVGTPPPTSQSSLSAATKPASSTPPNTKVTLNTKDVPPNTSVKTYSPGQSETLIPMPYVGNTSQNAVARKPVRKGSDSLTGSRSPSTLSVNTSMLTPNEGNSNSSSSDNGTMVPIFKMPEFGRPSPLGPSTEKSMGPDEKFAENEISFEGAPAFDDDDDDDSSDDDGLWAKKPPTLVEPKPELHVETTSSPVSHPALSPVTPYKSSSTIASPVRIVDEYGTSWAVRPPPEVVYDNMDRFFPNTDLDQPIIDDDPLSPIASSAVETENATLTTSGGLAPVTEPKESPVHQSKPWRIQPVKIREQRAAKPTAAAAAASAATTLPASTQQDTERKLSVAEAITSDAHNGPTVTNSKFPAAKLRVPTRMKSLRIVAREASEARKRFSSANASGLPTSGALLRRKSTKMWGQKVVEMKPNEIRDGNLSTLRDQKGEFKQFVWVKGELIGKGTFGKVYLALNATTGEMMAVKQVEVPQSISDKDSERQKEVVGALHSEVETLKDLDHLNIVQYLGFEALPDVYNLFLEYVPGGSVGRCLRMYGRFEEPIIKSLTHQVLDGLSYLHSRGILHRVSKSTMGFVRFMCNSLWFDILRNDIIKY
ncbi:mitogen-activated protein kinase kinase kinase BCK1 [Sugiyamaella lignohabitans]|uniref:Mitogen-activated protein kinase kinase kinase BCK1 n=1 Tax=Sugiyamaella lignohabitans TaxID=796027 RepID=A0A161HJI5_9ASCO|nr:mitogen-activated protein kinase kinase kinase BCK1 [Sugiyamaella lignohabitans]ANB12877.1 mitogen-activated protein kinase kinase kinase BCK1 [Sugiyamaella lignohabitans]